MQVTPPISVQNSRQVIEGRALTEPSQARALQSERNRVAQPEAAQIDRVALSAAAQAALAATAKP